MAVQLFGNLGLQGGGVNVQNTGNPQVTGNPQQTYNPVAPVQPVAPVAAPRPIAAPRPVVAPIASPRPVAVPTAQPIQINAAYAPYVQTRPSPQNPGVLEYYNPQNGAGFSNQNDVLNYVRTMTGHSVSDLNQLSAQSSYGGQTSQIQSSPQQQFAQLAAQSGLSIDDYLKFAGGTIGATDRNTINTGLGIPDLYNQLFTPAPKTQDLYNNAYKSAGLADLKASIQAKLDEVNKIQSAYTDKAGNLNENPFLSEASRVGRLRILDDKRLQDVGNLNNQLQSMQDLYNNGLNEVNSVVSRTTQDFSNNQQVNAYKLQILQQQAEQQLNDLQSSKQSQAYQYLPDYLKAKAQAQKPDTIGNADTGFFSWNPTTGSFEQVIAPQVDQYKQLQIQKLQQELAGGGNASELLSVSDAQALGVPYGTTKGQAVAQGITPSKPATDAQNQAATYAVRIKQAGSAIDSVSSKIVSMNAAQYEAEKRLPSYLQSANYQSYDQAARNLINAVLRRESGAAISTGEFDNAYAQYLPKPGDTAQTLAQKTQNRNAILNGLIQSAGSAYGQLTGSGNTGFGSASDPLGLFGERGGGSKVAVVNQKFPDGTVGGQCGTFAHKIADFPPVGNYLSQKQATVNKSGVLANVWRSQGAKLGDVIISNIGEYGHVSVVVGKQPDGKLVVKDSNYGLNEKVQTRIISINDSKIYGVLRGTLKV